MIFARRRVLFAVGWCWPVASTTAFSSISIPSHIDDRRLGRKKDTTPAAQEEQQQQLLDKSVAPAVTSTAPWRLALDIGREPLSTGMPHTWARSGCRMPIVVRCDVSSARIRPQKDTVSFTGVDGAVIRPIVGGPMQLLSDTMDDHKKNDHAGRPRDMTFQLTFPEAMARRDVTIDADTTLYCTGQYYTQYELDLLNRAYTDARDEVWTIGGRLNDMTKLQGPPKRWNDETKQWERRYPDGKFDPIAWAQKRIQYITAKAKQTIANGRRPDPNSLSERGSIPGVDGAIYIVKEGLVRSSSPTGPVMGRWSMAPILNRPVSYYRR